MPCALEKKKNKDSFQSERSQNTVRMRNDIAGSFGLSGRGCRRPGQYAIFGGQCFLLRRRNLFLPEQERRVF